MTSRQREVLALIASGKSRRDIARALHISPNTVDVLTQQVAAQILAHHPTVTGATCRERVVAYCSLTTRAA